jgi:hypothetical protein
MTLMLFMVLGFLWCVFTYPVKGLAFIFQGVAVFTSNRTGDLFVASYAVNVIGPLQTRFVRVVEVPVRPPQRLGREGVGRMAPSAGDIFRCSAVLVASYAVLVFNKGPCSMMMTVSAIFGPIDMTGVVEPDWPVKTLKGIEVQDVRHAFGLGIGRGCR